MQFKNAIWEIRWSVDLNPKSNKQTYLRGIRHIKIGRPSNLLRMGGTSKGGAATGSVLTSTTSTFGIAFPPRPEVGAGPPPEVGTGLWEVGPGLGTIGVGAGLCPFLLFGVDFLTGKIREIAARFFSEDSSATGGWEADWLLLRR